MESLEFTRTLKDKDGEYEVVIDTAAGVGSVNGEAIAEVYHFYRPKSKSNGLYGIHPVSGESRKFDYPELAWRLVKLYKAGLRQPAERPRRRVS